MKSKAPIIIGGLTLATLLTLLIARKSKATPEFQPSGDDWFKMRLVNFPLEETTGWYVDFRDKGGSIYGKGTWSLDYTSNIPDLFWQRKELPSKIAIEDNKVIVDDASVVLYGFPDPTYRKVFGGKTLGSFTFIFQRFTGYYPVTYNLNYKAGIIAKA